MSCCKAEGDCCQQCSKGQKTEKEVGLVIERLGQFQKEIGESELEQAKSKEQING